MGLAVVASHERTLGPGMSGPFKLSPGSDKVAHWSRIGHESFGERL